MAQLYVVRRPFKTGGVFYDRGSLIEDPSTIKLFNIKVNEGKILPLPESEEELEGLCQYFLDKLGVDLKGALEARASKGSQGAPEPPKAPTQPTPQVPPQTQKPSTPPPAKPQSSNK